ncbi:hypothetical protein PRK78_000559 [Emydomyces testavorans]|uniref:Uncharacterized protein n=1 Tax=Emydomyces testavorans TaxID=2070801 RepID=A0AAF0DBZ7_9EURO|nr:hypothetical protein PRK78_000559 [Emydomyces testavorans]
MSAEGVNGGPTESVPAPDKPVELNGNGAAAQPETLAKTSAQPTDDKEKEAENDKAAGDKRNHDEAGPAREEEKTTAEEPPEKKQKTKTETQPDVEAEPATHDTEHATVANGAKKRGPGRPKKGEVKKQQKAPTPRSGDGIGSRTRSRTKA